MAGAMAFGEGLIGMVMSSEQGAANKEMGGFNASVNERNAVIATQEGRADARQSERQSAKIIGGATANYGASGITMDGSATDVLADSAAQAKLQTQNILFDAHLKSLGFTENAQLDRYRARYDLTASQYAATASLLRGSAKAYDYGVNGGSPNSGTPLPNSTAPGAAQGTNEDAGIGGGDTNA